MKKRSFILAVLAVFAAFSYAQVSDFLTEMIETEEVTFGQASYLCMVHKNPENEKFTYSEAMGHAIIEGVFPDSIVSKFSAIDPNIHTKIPLSNLCSMLAKVFEVRGGALFMLTKGTPRYAFRQFQVDGIVPLAADESLYVSGEEALNMYTRCIRIYGE